MNPYKHSLVLLTACGSLMQSAVQSLMQDVVLKRQGNKLGSSWPWRPRRLPRRSPTLWRSAPGRLPVRGSLNCGVGREETATARTPKNELGRIVEVV